MSIKNIFGIAGTAMNAQTIRMNTTASNLANAGTIAGSEEDAFRAKRSVFKALVDRQDLNRGFEHLGGVKVAEIVDDQTPVRKVYDPTNPASDADGYMYASNVSEVTEMVEMIAASRSYQNNVEVVTTARQLMLKTLDLTKV